MPEVETLMDRLHRQMKQEFPAKDVPLVDDSCDCIQCREGLTHIRPCEREERR